MRVFRLLPSAYLCFLSEALGFSTEDFHVLTWLYYGFQLYYSRFTFGMCIVLAFPLLCFVFVGLLLVCLGKLLATACVNVGVFWFLGFYWACFDCWYVFHVVFSKLQKCLRTRKWPHLAHAALLMPKGPWTNWAWRSFASGFAFPTVYLLNWLIRAQLVSQLIRVQLVLLDWGSNQQNL